MVRASDTNLKVIGSTPFPAQIFVPCFFCLKDINSNFNKEIKWVNFSLMSCGSYKPSKTLTANP